MLLTLLGLYAGASAVYWGVKYHNTKDEKKRDAAVKNLGSSYLECLKWPADLFDGVKGFEGKNDEADDDSKRG